ncbi:MAG: TSUP family transporter [Gammaproteobacteria bacterium]|nr:TSUP family transporter [Gammaproteobacteria bacterium]
MYHVIIHSGLFKLILLGMAGMIAGFIDTITGSGGVFAIPVLLLFGIAPVTALGTNKLQEVIGGIAATANYIKKGELKPDSILWGALVVVIGSSLGALFVQQLSCQLLRKIIPFLLLGVLIYLLLPKRKHQETPPKISQSLFYLIFGLLIGFYNGFWGPGSSALWVALMMFLLNFNLRHAVIYAKPLNLIGNTAGLVWFSIKGHVSFSAGFVMGIGALIGAQYGVHFVLKKNVKWIKLFFAIVIFISIVTLFQSAG